MIGEASQFSRASSCHFAQTSPWRLPIAALRAAMRDCSALSVAIRSRQMAMSRMRMMTEVATADVVLVNPTHVAVALRYESAKGAPRVVAKGAGVVALKIREKAAENRVPMVQDIPLARALYKACDIGQEIPPEMFAAIAQVLAFVMSLKARGSAAGTHKVPVLSRR